MTTRRSLLAVFALSGVLSAQASVFPGSTVPLRGVLPGGSVVSMSRGLLVDLDHDGAADCIGPSWGGSALILCRATGGSFQSPGVAFPSSQYPTHAFLDDVDGDGDEDVVLVCHGDGALGPHIRIHFNDGALDFTASIVIPVPANYTRASLGHLNGDGIGDLVLGDGLSSSIVFGTGTGSFSAPIEWPVTSSYAVLSDDDHDGDDDLHEVSNGIVTVRRNAGDGTFGAPLVVATGWSNAYALAVSDMNGDGLDDYVLSGTVANSAMTGVQTLTRQPAGGFVPVGSVLLVPRACSSGPILADVSGDGRPDVLLFDPDGSGAPGAVLVCCVNDGSGTFNAPQLIDQRESSTFWGVGTCDFTGDGLRDVVWFSATEARLYPSRGAAGLVAPEVIPVGTIDPTSAFDLGDLDGDGRLDAVISTRSGTAGTYTIVRSLRDAPITTVIQAPVPIFDVKLADVNHDGALDLLAAVGTFNGISVRAGDGQGGFLAPSFVPTNGAPSALTVADVNGDGNLDLVVRDAAVSVLLGNGIAGFGAPIVAPICTGNCPPIAPPSVPAVADVDRDGILDLVFTTPPAYGAGSITFARGNGNGTFTVMPSVPDSAVSQPHLADVDGDGSLDVIECLLGLWVRHGNGDGTFGPAAQFAPSNLVTGLGGVASVGDIDGDGDVDVVVATGAVILNDGAGTFTFDGPFVSANGLRIRLVDADRDMQLDAVTLDGASDAVVIYRNRTGCSGHAVPYGVGCPGSGGFVPTLWADGCATPGGTMVLHVEGVLGGAPAWLVAGTGSTSISLGSGCRLYVDPNGLALFPITTFGLPVAGQGHHTLSIPLGAATPPGLVFAMQIAVADSASPIAFAGSNGLLMFVQ